MLVKIRYFFYHLFNLIEYLGRAQLIRFLEKDKIAQRQKLTQNIHNSAKKFMKSFQIDLKVEGIEHLKALKDSKCLVVANHVSYTDIVILSSLEKLVFITSVEMGNNPFLGTITRLGGCLYTNRKKPLNLKQEIEAFSEVLKQGFKLVLFPEGTSTDGSTVKEFKRSLFQIAQNANAPVLPICIKYKTLDGKKIDDANKDYVYWYGDMYFAGHFLKLMGRKLQVELTIMQPTFESQALKRAELSDKIHSQIHSCFHS